MAGKTEAVATSSTGLSFSPEAFQLLVRYEAAKGGFVDVAAVAKVLGGKYKSAWDKVDKAKKTLAAELGSVVESPKKRGREAETPALSPQLEEGEIEEPPRKKISFVLPAKKKPVGDQPLGGK